MTNLYSIFINAQYNNTYIARDYHVFAADASSACQTLVNFLNDSGYSSIRCVEIKNISIQNGLIFS